MIELHMYDKLRKTWQPMNMELWKFPAGEIGVRVRGGATADPHDYRITMYFQGSDDLVLMTLLADALRANRNCANLYLLVPYMPYARQDRIAVGGEPLSLRAMCRLINSLDFYEIKVHDAHSDVLEGMFPAGKIRLVEQLTLFSEDFPALMNSMNNSIKDAPTYLVSPDRGAHKKIHRISAVVSLPVICADKVRDPVTGQIKLTTIESLPINEPTNFIVVDDIIDGGRTFIELAQLIRQQYPVKCLALWATHGIFSKGRAELEKHYDVIQVHHDFTTLQPMFPRNSA